MKNQFLMIFDTIFFTANRIFPVSQRGVQNFVDVYIYTEWEFSICAMVGFVDKDFLLGTSSRKIKSHVVESHIKSLVWPWLSLTEKQRTVNHMIIFNPIQDWEGGRRGQKVPPPYQFFPCNLYKRRN